VKKLVILGGGESGTGAALLGKAKGFQVFLSDSGSLQEKYRQELIQNQVEFEENGHSIERILEADEVVKSPGIPDKVPLIQQIKACNIPIISEIELASRYTKAKLIGITGSNGKTTTTLLTYHLLKSAGLKVGLAGNIGESFARQVIDDQYDYFVLELSSFQLDNMYQCKAHIAVLLNITPDHLDRYNYSFDNYRESKFRICQNQTAEDYFIYYKESEAITFQLEKLQLDTNLVTVSLLNQPSQSGSNVSTETLVFNISGTSLSLSPEEQPLKGPHNKINTMSAVSVALLLGIKDTVIKQALTTFQNAPHRLELVTTINGVTYINDSKATNVDSVFYALGSFNSPIILILGGVDKGNDYSQLDTLVANKVKAIIAMGTDNSKLDEYYSDISKPFKSVNSLSEAVTTATEWATEGDIVLLSPACASFDLFKNYEDRGNQFRELALSLQDHQ
jgi:UDP-N-acetylmuramoylalanine--D-glutamate ligase